MQRSRKIKEQQGDEYKTTAEIVKFSLCKNKEKKKDIIIQWN